MGALLGPEGSVACGWLVSCANLLVILYGVAGWSRWYVENYTVDASIFVDIDKLLSAVGGCLGTKSR